MYCFIIRSLDTLALSVLWGDGDHVLSPLDTIELFGRQGQRAVSEGRSMNLYSNFSNCENVLVFRILMFDVFLILNSF